MYTKVLKAFYRRLEIVVRLLLGFKRSTIFRGVKRTLQQARLLVPPYRVASNILKRVNKLALFVFLILVCVFSSLSIIIGSQWYSITISSGGNVRAFGIGVYNDVDCSIAVESLDWGILEPGSAQDIIMYIRNEGNDAATLFLETENWNPSDAPLYMTMDWNYDGRFIDPEEVIEVTLTLAVSDSVSDITSFSFDIILGSS